MFLDDFQHPSPNMKTLCNFEPQIWPESITSCDAESAYFKGSRTSCDVINSDIFVKFWTFGEITFTLGAIRASRRLFRVFGEFHNLLPGGFWGLWGSGGAVGDGQSHLRESSRTYRVRNSSGQEFRASKWRAAKGGSWPAQFKQRISQKTRTAQIAVRPFHKNLSSLFQHWPHLIMPRKGPIHISPTNWFILARRDNPNFEKNAPRIWAEILASNQFRESLRELLRE